MLLPYAVRRGAGRKASEETHIPGGFVRGGGTALAREDYTTSHRRPPASFCVAWGGLRRKEGWVCRAGVCCLCNDQPASRLSVQVGCHWAEEVQTGEGWAVKDRHRFCGGVEM